MILDNNRISIIPREIGSLSKLETLRLISNRLATIPREIFNITNLRCVELCGRGNRILYLPPPPPPTETPKKEISFYINRVQLWDIPATLTNISNIDKIYTYHHIETGDYDPFDCCDRLDFMESFFEIKKQDWWELAKLIYLFHNECKYFGRIPIEIVHEITKYT